MNQCEQLLEAMRRGESLTVADALGKYGVYALSQRCGELIKQGHPVRVEMITVPSGKRVAKYSIPQGQQEMFGEV